ncbi:MAG: transcription-repair coupling factor, partial [Rickettsiaceae bacterium]|nr:transcription-repair coupling factor [Rickettsiaceae bacterium]
MSKIAIPFIAKSFFAYQQFSHNRKNILLTFADTESALKAYKQLQFIASNPAHEILYFPSLDTVPYDRISPHNDILSTRARVLSTLSNDTSAKIIVTAAENLLLKLPPKEIFSKNSLTLKTGMKNTLEEIATFLVNNGFKKISSAIESGEFAIRGEIIDIVTNQEKGYRIYFGWDNIETIKQYNLQTQISTRKIAELHLTSASEIFLNSDTITNFKNNFLKLFGVNHVASPVYKSITSGQKFQGYEHLMPLFYNKMITLDEYLSEHSIIYDNLALQATLEY